MYAVVGEDAGDMPNCDPVPKGDIIGVWGRLGPRSNGELGADVGVSGRPGAKRKEWEDARLDGLEIGRRVGVRKRKGTPAISSRCLCIKSRT